MENIFLSFILLSLFISFIECYNNTNLKNITADDLYKYSKEDGYEGCYALYDSGADRTETCTQFKLEFPYICCKVHYTIGVYKNDFCMPIANNADAIGDVVKSFKNADEIDIDCHSNMIKFFINSILFLFIFIC